MEIKAALLDWIQPRSWSFLAEENTVEENLVAAMMTESTRLPTSGSSSILGLNA